MNLHTKILYIILLVLINSTLINGENHFYINNKRKPDTVKWKVHNAEIKKCYVNGKNDYSSAVIRLYEDNFFEYYNYNSKFFVDTGRYTMIGPFLFLNKTDKHKSFFNKSYKSVYFRAFNNLFTFSLFRRFSNKKEKKFKLPFYVNPNTGIIVKDKNASNKVNITELVTELIKKAETEQEKFNIIVDFILKSTDYDYKGLKDYNFYNSQRDVSSILAGRKRFAVCEGYARTLETMCNIANIKCKYVSGAARSDFNDIVHISAENHAWNIVRIDSIYKVVDITWVDGAGYKWFNTSAPIMVYSHIPKNEEDQLLKKTISKEIIDDGPVIEPLYGINKKISHLPNFSPKTGLCYIDSIFTFILDTIIDNINVTTLSNNALSTIYLSEKSQSRWISYNSTRNYDTRVINGQTIVRINLKNKITAISINVDNAFEFQYEVVRGGKEWYMRYLQKKANNKYIDSYIKGICASLYLNDKYRLTDLVDEYNELFFNEDGDIKKELLEEFSNWDSKISYWNKSVHYINDNPPTTINSIYSNNLRFAFEKNDGIYEIIEVKR